MAAAAEALAGAALTDPAVLRHVFGHYPTGVVAVTAIGAAGDPVGMAVGSFSSASLSPPLVSFLVDEGSSTFPHIRRAGAFCACVLSSSQLDVSRTLAQRGGDKFAALSWSRSPVSGSPILDGAAAWFDCDIVAEYPAGDHQIVLGRVRAMDLAPTDARAEPLVFLRGAYVRLGDDARAVGADQTTAR